MSFAHDFSVTQTASQSLFRDQIGSLVNSATVVTLSAQGTRDAACTRAPRSCHAPASALSWACREMEN